MDINLTFYASIYNDLTALPTETLDMKILQELDLKGNNIEHIIDLFPDNLLGFKLKKSKTLDLINNKLIKLP